MPGKILTILIPCFNEEKGLPKVLAKIPKSKLRELGYQLEILVVDNNSQDKTAQLARKVGAVVVSEPRQGKGFALAKGFKVAKGDFIVTIDGDNTYPAEDIFKLVKEIDQADLVIGSRFAPIYNLSRLAQPRKLAFTRTLANKVGALLATVILGCQVSDVTTGLRVFRKSLLHKLPPIRAKGLDFETEFSARVIKQGFVYREVRIGTNWREGQSSLRYFEDAFKFLWAMVRGRYF